mmetsp:Transcript_8019/g.13476  ORF Transcript_8019/g.13476 Transcript_8019/m.13476 type:complete len:201 (+) Transcript_8019:55-657(+)
MAATIRRGHRTAAAFMAMPVGLAAGTAKTTTVRTRTVRTRMRVEEKEAGRGCTMVAGRRFYPLLQTQEKTSETRMEVVAAASQRNCACPKQSPGKASLYGKSQRGCRHLTARRAVLSATMATMARRRRRRCISMLLTKKNRVSPGRRCRKKWTTASVEMQKGRRRGVLVAAAETTTAAVVAVAVAMAERRTATVMAAQAG